MKYILILIAALVLFSAAVVVGMYLAVPMPPQVGNNGVYIFTMEAR